MKKAGFKERFTYWFDTRMSKGTISMIKMLTVATLIVVLVLALIITVGGFSEDGGFFSVFWNNLATVINAWMPYSEDGSAGYVILTAIAAIAGLLVTSVLIGIISSGIEEKLTGLRKGNSRILEESHKVILGFVPGEYELIRQLITAVDGDKTVLVIAEEMERDEMEDLIHENVEIPKNIKIICRNADICDHASLERLSIPDSHSVVISPMDDSRAVKAVLAVKKVLEENDNTSTVVSASVTKDKFLLPTGKISLIMLQTYDIIARILAHSGTQPGLSEAFMEVMSFEGSEFYLERYPEAEGLTFREITNRTEGAAVAGMEIDGELVLSPDKEKVLSQNSRVLFFTENRKNYHLISKEDLKKQKNEEIPVGENNKTSDDGRSDHGKKDNKNVISNILNGSDEKVVIIGTNEVTDTVLKELPERKTEVVFAGISEKEFEEIKSLSIERNDLSISYYNGQIDDINDLNELMKNAGHAILLSRHEEDRESDDMDNMLLLLKLRQLRDERGLSFSIAAEMFSEKNRALVSASDPTDFIVANNLSSMVLAQMAEDPNLFPVFHELLSNEGTDLFLAKAGDVLQLSKTIAVRQLKLAALELGWVILGFVDNSPQGRSVTLNPSQETLITPDEQDYLIIIGQQK
ncbi:MAG: hypothetical protein K6E85_14920 [Lachnospiraceae bacterium]|nr:hypothetical protein [Lachnospiraceae bacterium]